MNKIQECPPLFYNRLDHYLAMAVMLLMAIGAVFVFSASAEITGNDDLSRFYDYPGIRQILFLPIAYAVLYVFWRLDYRKLQLKDNWLKSPVVYLLAVSIALLILVLFPQVGTSVNYARRWLRVPAGPITLSFQPSELAKWSVVLFLAAFCHKYSDSLKQYWKKFIPVCALIAVVAGLILVEDFGTAVFITVLAFLILIISGVKFSYILTLVPFGLAGFCGALIASPYKLARIIAFLNPDKWADSANYQANQSLIAIGSGQLFGKGLGRGICKYGHLPEDTTDFIFAIIGEELGFVGVMSVVVLFIIIVWLGIVVLKRCKDRFGQLLATSIVLTLGIAAAINIGVVTVVLPTKGIPLPFVSAGGTSLLLSAAAAGVLLNIASQVGKDSGREVV